MAQIAKAKTGMKRFHYAVVTSDTIEGGTVYGTPVPITGIVDGTITPNSASTTLYADNGAYLVDSALGELKIELNMADFPLTDQAILLGHNISNGVMLSGISDSPIDCAIGWEGTNSNGHSRWVWLFKGKFLEPTDAYKTKGEKTEFQSQALTFTAVQRVSDGYWKVIADEDEPGFVASVGSGWFAAVSLGASADLVAPTAGVTPASGASTVLATANVVWTFDKAIKVATMIPSNFYVVKTSDGSLVAGSLVLSAGNTIVTFDPTASLTAGAAYTAIASTGVQSAGNIPLVAPKVTAFTVAS